MIDLKCNFMARQKTDYNIENELCVKDILAERGLLMKDFAEQIGITRETLTRALRGNPQYSTLKAIAEGLGVNVYELFKERTVQRPQTDIHGCIYVDGEPNLIKSKSDIEHLLKELNANH